MTSLRPARATPSPDGPGSAQPAGGPPLGISELSALLGVPAPTLRSWERRYRLPVGDRSAGRHRRYTAADVAVFRRMQSDIARGLSAAQAGSIAAALADGGPAGYVEAVCARALALDSRGMTASLQAARSTWGLEVTVDEVLLPAMREIGRRWAAGACDVAHEHAATSAVGSWLAAVQLDAPAPTRTGTVILACGPRDAHTLGLQSLSALLAHRGVDCRLLGAATPVHSLVVAVEEARAAAVVVVGHLPASRSGAVAAVRAAAETSARVYYAGDAFRTPRSRDDLPGSYLAGSMALAADQLVAVTSAP